MKEQEPRPNARAPIFSYFALFLALISFYAANQGLTEAKEARNYARKERENRINADLMFIAEMQRDLALLYAIVGKDSAAVDSLSRGFLRLDEGGIPRSSPRKVDIIFERKAQ